MSDSYWNEINQNTTNVAKGFIDSMITNGFHTYKSGTETYTSYSNTLSEITTGNSSFVAIPQRNSNIKVGDNVTADMFIGAISTSPKITIKSTCIYTSNEPDREPYTKTRTNDINYNDIINVGNEKYYLFSQVGTSFEPSPYTAFYIPCFNNVNYWGSNFVKVSKKYGGAYTEYATKYLQDEDNINQWISSIPVLDITGDISSQVSQIKIKWENDLEDTVPKLRTDWTLAVDGTKSPLYKLKWKCPSLSENDIARVRIGYGGFDDISGKISIHKWQLVDYSPSHFNTNYAQINNAVWGAVAEIVSPLATLATVYIAVQLEYYSTPTVLPTDYSSIMYCELFKNQKNGHMYGDIGFLKKDENGLYSKVATGDGSTFTVKDGEEGSKIVTDNDDDGYSNDKDDDENNIDTSDVSAGIGVLTTTFKMSKDRLQQLGRFLWGSNIFDNFSLICNNPIENIISCKSIPLSLDGATQKIILGNVDTGVNGDKVANNFTSQTIGSIKINEKYNNFLDYAPYTNVIIYLPYVGFKELDTNLVMNKTLSISYTVDVITGGCLCQIQSDGVRLYEFNGNLGIDIPITASNRAQVEAGYISSGIGIASSAASGNIVGAVTSLINSAEAQYHYASTSSPNPMCVASTNRTCYVIIDRPTYQTLKSFNHTRGKKCYLTKTINSLKGYTICDEHIDLSGIRATESEKEELVRLLSGGFFVN